jgi:hypothetical protein
VDFEIISDITNIEIIATGTGIRNRERLQKQYGKGKWRKLKGIAQVQLPNGIGLFGLCDAMDGGYKGWNPYIERHLAIFVNSFRSRAN